MSENACGIPSLPLPSIDCARAVRDGAIDAIAALNAALVVALEGMPPEQARELKQAFGKVMGEAVFELINPAVRAYPELEPDPETWAAVVRERLAARNAQLAG
jgi:hypothetical protein